jgi:hypothetical protein
MSKSNDFVSKEYLVCVILPNGMIGDFKSRILDLKEK